MTELPYRAKLLYSIAFETERRSIYYPSTRPIGRDLLVLGLSTICYQDGLREDNDPRYVLTKRGNQMPTAELHPSEIEHASPELSIIFKPRLIRGTIPLPSHPWQVLTDEKGFEESEIPTCLQLLSTAWFDVAEYPGMKATPKMSSYSMYCDALAPEDPERRALNRYGLKSAVPLPSNSKDMSFDISTAPILHPTWGTKGDPGPHKEVKEISGQGPTWAVSYESSLLNMSDLALDDEDLMIMIAMAEQEERQKEKYGRFESTSNLDIKYVKVPLLDALRPPIASESPYYYLDDDDENLGAGFPNNL